MVFHFYTLFDQVLHSCIFGGFHFQNPNYMKDGFHITIESLHLADRGETENVSNFVYCSAQAKTFSILVYM